MLRKINVRVNPLYLIMLLLFILANTQIYSKENKVYMRIKKTEGYIFLGKNILYNYKNLPITQSELMPSYFFIGTKNYKFHYFIKDKYIPYGDSRFDTVFMRYTTIFEGNNRINNPSKRGFSGNLFKFNNDQLLYKTEAWFYYNKRKSINPYKTSIKYRHFELNKEGYPVSVDDEWSFNSFTQIFEPNYDPNAQVIHTYEYEYEDDILIYNGKKKIKRINAYNTLGYNNNISSDLRGKKLLESYYDFEYDEYNRIKSINEISLTAGKDYLLRSKFFYFNNLLFIINETRFDSNFTNINIYCSIYNKYGYLNRSDYRLAATFVSKRDRSGTIKIESTKDFFEKFEKGDIKLPKRAYYIYERANPKYKDNLALQQIFHEKQDLTGYYLGIHDWFRYKYLHDIKEEPFDYKKYLSEDQSGDFTE